MKVNEKVALIAAYYMSRFNSNLGYGTSASAFEKVSEITGVEDSFVRRDLRDSFDYWFPWRMGWPINDPRNKWDEYNLGEIFKLGNKFSEEELKTILVMLGVWSKDAC